MTNRPDSIPNAGWASSLRVFAASDAKDIRAALESFVDNVGDAQRRAWQDSVPALQRGARLIPEPTGASPEFSTILEYQLPMESRRSDAVFLVGAPVLVLELKGKSTPSQADLDQARGYARDLRTYHRSCHARSVQPVLVAMRRRGPAELIDGIWVSGPDVLHELVNSLMAESPGPALDVAEFLDESAYRPLPSIVQAARELFFSRELREVWRARAATTPAVDHISGIAHEAARTKSRHLILLTGVPGAGKTLVGMRLVHSHFLDDIAVPRAGSKPTVPGLYLSGNGPLVEVLQYALKQAGGGGRVFVRHIKNYLEMHVAKSSRVPDEHLLVFDEAQRAFTPDRVSELHKRWPAALIKGEPQLFVDLCERIPEWSVLVGLVGGGQEIHLGEEGGIAQWRDAVLGSSTPSAWTVHAPPGLARLLEHPQLSLKTSDHLNLDEEIRFHGATELHRFVEYVLEPGRSNPASAAADSTRTAEPWRLQGIRLYVTRELEHAKDYLRERYGDQRDARFGLLASSRDRDLAAYGVDNSYQTTKQVKPGPWYVGGDENPHSCRQLNSCMTEFGAQGLELEMALVAWGTDLVRVNGSWDNSRARKYKKGSVALRDPYQLRLNAYRVLLTRGRDGTIVFVPPTAVLDETYEFLTTVGFKRLTP